MGPRNWHYSSRCQAPYQIFCSGHAFLLNGDLLVTGGHMADKDDFTDAVPAFLTMITTSLTFSIATGLSPGLLSFTFPKVITGAAQGDQGDDLGPQRAVSSSLRISQRRLSFAAAPALS